MNKPESTQPKTEHPDAPAPDNVSAGALPDEPFACPNCGQLLGPAVRVCVSCGQPVDFSKVHRGAPATEMVRPEFTPAAPPPAVEPVRFSWSIFAAVLVAWLAAAVVGERFLTPVHEQYLLLGIVCVTSSWVLYDARSRNVPHPFRWSIASVLLWIVFFPWYLARRSRPNAPCTLMDQAPGRLLRWLIPIFVFFILFSLIVALLHGPKK
jgi:hypothetical protein